MRMTNLCEFVKTGLRINSCDFYLCITYGAIKFMQYKLNFMQPVLDSHNSHK